MSFPVGGEGRCRGCQGEASDVGVRGAGERAGAAWPAAPSDMPPPQVLRGPQSGLCPSV